MNNHKKLQKRPYVAPETKVVECRCEQGYAFSLMRTERFRDSEVTGDDFWGNYNPKSHGTESFDDQEWNW